jgi:hypothetical protein
MTWTLRISAQMLGNIRRDLMRPHAHAAERVGFVHARIGNHDGRELQVLPYRYAPVEDADYLRDDKVGARFGSNAIRQAMQISLTDASSVLHVHMHEHRGRPRFSQVDLESYPSLVRSFRNVSPGRPHGALLLSDDAMDCLLWPPGRDHPEEGGRIVIVGRPMGFASGTGGLYA